MTITLIAASLLGLWLMILSYNVVKYRFSTKTSIGDSGSPEMLRAVRAHANFTEYGPMCLILLGLLEYNRAHPILLLAVAILVVAGRVMHGLGLGFSEVFEKDTNLFRMLGILMTWTALIVASIAGLLIAYGIL